MARTHVVKSGKKARRCQACGQQIEVGQSYKWFKMKLTYGGVQKSYHVDCAIPRSHRTSSQHLGTLWDAVDTAESEVDNCESVEGLESVLSAAAEGVREASEGYRESAENIESGFGHPTYVSDELNEKADEIEQFADSLEDVDFDEFDEDDARENATAALDNEEADDEEIAAAVEELRDEWLEEQRSKARDALSDCPF